MEIKAAVKYIHQSPRKIRAVANTIRHLPIAKALEVLSLWHKKASSPLRAALLSAVANAKHNFGIEKENLAIKELRINPGPILKRTRPRARGQANVIKKRMAHIQLILAERENLTD